MTLTASRSLLLIFILLVAAEPIRMSSAQENQEKAGRAYYAQVTEGMIGSAAFPYQFTSAKLRLEVRNLVMGHSKAGDVPTPTDILMELRGGIVTTTINGQAQERIQGDFWTVEKGSKLAIESPGPVAVIRAIYVYPGSK